jgi:hypothetical protein
MGKKEQTCTSNASLGGMYWKGHGYHLQSMRLQYVKMRGVVPSLHGSPTVKKEESKERKKRA